MNHSHPAVLGTVLVALFTAAHTEAALRTITIDDFQTSVAGSGPGILGTRSALLDSYISSPATWSQTLNIGGGIASSYMQVSTTGIDGYLQTVLMYSGFGSVDLTHAAVRVAGQVFQSSYGSGSTRLFLVVDSVGGSAELSLNATSSATDEWLLDFSSLGGSVDLSAITRFRLFARAIGAGGGSAELSYSLTRLEIVAVPVPSAAALLALAGLTAGSRRRK